MNPKLFGAIVVVGAALAGCRTGILADPDLSIGAAHDLGTAVDLASRDQGSVDLAQGDLPICCIDGAPQGADLSGCIPISCILI